MTSIESPEPASLATEDWNSARLRRLRVSELFCSLQGEGSRSGLPTVFLRLTGCALRCRWCDTEWAFVGGEWQTNEQLEAAILAYDVRRLCLTGGEPLLQPAAMPLLRRLKSEHHFDIVVETGGDQDISIVPAGVIRVLDIKLQGSGMSERMDLRNIDRLEPHDEVKLVIANRHDYEQAREWVLGALRSFRGEILFSPVAEEVEPASIAEWILADRLPVRMQLQLHKLLWPGVEKGV
ncbi:MAG: radical SAM protein [Acidobacteriota bacterium]